MEILGIMGIQGLPGIQKATMGIPEPATTRSKPLEDILISPSRRIPLEGFVMAL